MEEEEMITVGSLFAGIGGIELGLERTGGFRTVWQVENDGYATRVLEKHWPDVRRWGDVRTFPPEPVGEWRCDLICGGFPCQDISYAGKGAGIDGERSGLWREFVRVVGLLRPRFVLVENVAAILVRGMGCILGDLASFGYDAEWEVLPAASFGAPHFRSRVFYFANRSTPDANDQRCHNPLFGPPTLPELVGVLPPHTWPRILEPPIHRDDDGVPSRVDRLRCLGNAVVPQVAEWIGQRILESE